MFEESPGGDRAFDLYSKLLRERIILLGTPFDDAVADVVSAQLLHLESEDPHRDVHIYINSPGGGIAALLAIYDTMQYIRCDVRTVCVGQAASAAAVLLGAGAVGKRLALPHARIVIRQPRGGATGQAVDVDIQAKEILRMRALLDEILAHHTGRPVDRVRADTDRNFIMSAEEARDYGLVDEVLSSRDLAQVASAAGVR